MNDNFKPTSVSKTLLRCTTQLDKSGIASARLDALLLMGHAMKKERHWLLAHGEHMLTTQQQEELQRLIDQRAHYTPVAYLLGRKEFYGRDFIVTPATLVPRPETEDVVELALAISAPELDVIDLGTGTGIIGLTLLAERPVWHVTLADNSVDALMIARQNAEMLGKTALPIRHQDLLVGDKSHYDLVIANLPYLPEKLRTKQDISHEPGNALFSGDDGLDHYRKLFATLKKREQKITHLVTESLLTQHSAMIQLAHQAGYTLVATRGLAQHFSISA